MNQLQTKPVPAVSLKPDICYFGIVSDKQKQERTFGILQDDRRKHMYILGKTGMGKTTLLQNMILQDIYNGFGVCFIDPHGDPAEYILDRIPAHRQQDVVYFNPADTDFPIGLNMLESRRGEESFLVASGLVAVFHRIWSGMWSARMEYILNNTLLALLESPGHTLLSIVQMLTDDSFRKRVVSGLQDPLVKNFWTREFASFNDRYRQEAISPILNKIGQFLSTDLIRNIVGQKQSTVDFRDIMDNQKILIVNLAKGRIGEDNSNLLGSLILTKLQLAALSRVDIAEEQRKDFYVYVDEFQNFTTDSFATILSEARKYRLNLILAHQYISQLSESGNDRVRNAIFGNIGTLITFRVGSEDGDSLAREFAPVFQAEDLINLDKSQIALSLSINNKKSKPFLAHTLPPIFDKLNGKMASTVQSSRQQFGKPRQEVVENINQEFFGHTNRNQAKPLDQNSKPKPPAAGNTNQPAADQKLSSLKKSLQQTTKPAARPQITLPTIPQTPLSIPGNQKHSQSLESLKKARTQLSTATIQPRIVPGNLQNVVISDDNLFDVP